MKTNFLQRNRNKVSYKKRILAVLVIFVLGSLFFSFSRNLVVNIFSPLWRGDNAVALGFKNLTNFFQSKDALIIENHVLREKVASDKLVIMNLQLTSDGERIKMGKFISASVLVHPPQTTYDSLVIDAGSSSGVTLDAEVFLPEGSQIGVITEVLVKSSRVRLYSSNGKKTNAVLERDNVPITLLGRGGGNFEASLPRDMAVEVGDRILSAGLSEKLVGVVGDIEVSPTDSFKKVIVKSAVNIYSLRFVDVAL